MTCSRRLSCVLLAALALASSLAPAAHSEDPETGVKLRVTVLTRKLPKIMGRDSEWVGTKGMNNSIYGLEIAIDEPIPDLGIRYRFHTGNIGDTDWKTGFVDFQNNNIQGICIELTGKAAETYDVLYQGHIGYENDTQVFKNGAFCGTRGRGDHDLQSIVVVLKKRK